MTTRISNLKLVIAILLLLALAACGSRPSNSGGSGGGNSEAGSSSSGGSSVAAMPTANFNSVGEQSGLTTTTDIEAPAVEDAGPDLAMGERIYGNKCAECHGAGAEGTPDKGSALTALAQDYVEFEDLLRTGGELGPEHLFGTQAVSVNGLEAMHAYLQSLSN